MPHTKSTASREKTLSESQSPNLIFELLNQLKPLMPDPLSLAFQCGMTGGCVLGTEAPLLARDLWAMFLPGLPALGLFGELRPIAPKDVVKQIRERLRYGVPVSLFGFTGFLSPTTAPEEAEEVSSEEPTWEEPTVSRFGMVTHIDAEEIIYWREVSGEEYHADAQELCRYFSHLLRIKRAEKRGHRRDNIRYAILRWVAFGAAFPERLPADDMPDVAILKMAEQFLVEIAGKQRTPVVMRWRYAAECFSEGNVPLALDYLREAALRELHLPKTVTRALLESEPQPLDGTVRRELIYLARAGIPHLRALATERLIFEEEHEEVWRTLNQLCYDRSYWVRAIARPLHGSEQT